jgi:hypothetical protein
MFKRLFAVDNEGSLTKEREMFAVIEASNATHIVIHIPHEGSEKSLPALARMLEKNAVFVRSGYSDFSIVKPSMNIVLGDSYKIDRGDEELVINASTDVLYEDFQIATPDVLVSNAKSIKKKDDEISRQRTEINFLKQQLEQATAQIKALTELQSD